MNNVVMVAKMKDMHRISDVGDHLPRLNGQRSLLSSELTGTDTTMELSIWNDSVA